GWWVTKRAMKLHDVDPVAHVAAQVESRGQHFFRRNLHHPDARDATAFGREERALMTPLDQTLAQPHHDALPAAVLEHRQAHVVELHDVHGWAGRSRVARLPLRDTLQPARRRRRRW